MGNVGSFQTLNISIHVLREEDDIPTLAMTLTTAQFQSTSSARRTTGQHINGGLRALISIHVLREEDDKQILRCGTSRPYFNPRPPRGGRPHNVAQGIPVVVISIHVLREEDDHTYNVHKICLVHFNPRPPRGGRRKAAHRLWRLTQFQSTSSARRTTRKAPTTKGKTSISIHVLREEDDAVQQLNRRAADIFQSTSSARRTTLGCCAKSYFLL